MIYLILFVAVLASTIFAFIKYPKTSTVSLVFIFSICYLWFNLIYLPNRVISAIPTTFNVKKMLYRNEDAWGAGIVIYELPHETKESIEKYGIEYLNETYNKNNSPYNDDGIFRDWRKTPILINDAWTGPKMDGEPEPNTNTPKISDYLRRYNEGLDLDPKIEFQVNKIIQNGGSYYSYQNVRLIVVCPIENIIVYAYSR